MFYRRSFKYLQFVIILYGYILLCGCRNYTEDLHTFVLPEINKVEYQDGLCTEYYKNGKLKHTGRYKNNAETGLHQYYTPQGNLLCEKVFIDGTLRSLKAYRQFVPFAKGKFVSIKQSGYLKIKDGHPPMHEQFVPDNLLKVSREGALLIIFLSQNGGFKRMQQTSFGTLASSAQK